jgi:two-component system KDP operon response regulator KdpE
MSACVLLVEDNRELLRFLQQDLEEHGYRVETAMDGEEALRKFDETRPNIIVLDVALPKINGLEVCRRLRIHTNVPILMMSAHAVTEDEIADGLNIGADEYMLKPLGPLEFHARINALLRRARFTTYSPDAPTLYQDNYLSVDLNARRVIVDSREIRLTPTEFSLLATFIRHDDQVLTFQDLLEQVWGTEYKNEHHYPRIYVSHLRRKIEPDIKNPTYIHNEYGVGYRFNAQRN